LKLDAELGIARSTRDAAQRALDLANLRHQRGAATGLDVRQAQQLLYTGTSQIAATERQFGETEDALSLLPGRNPSGTAREVKLDSVLDSTGIPVGLPSELLARHPDIVEAEDTLIAANAQIGAAKALWFPQITLTDFFGGQSRALAELFTGPGRR
jgi:outer membrane protein TolC